jgi:HAD superfamily hydrolase (TIGR01662 family)
MEKGFMYLVAVMDWFSRRTLAWRLSNTLTTDFCIEALDASFAAFGAPEIFNTDQGSQFTSSDFQNRLIGQNVRIDITGERAPVPTTTVTVGQLLAAGNDLESRLVTITDVDFAMPRATWPDDAAQGGTWNVRVTDGTGEVTLRVTPGAVGVFGAAAPQYGFQVTGVVGEFDGTWQLFPRSADDVELLPGRREKLQGFVDQGYQLFLVSNQSGIASETLTAADAEAAFARTIELLGLPVAEVVYCPHSAFPVGCFCRKPLPGLGIALIQKHRLAREHLMMVGDMDSDDDVSVEAVDSDGGGSDHGVSDDDDKGGRKKKKANDDLPAGLMLGETRMNA